MARHLQTLRDGEDGVRRRLLRRAWTSSAIGLLKIDAEGHDLEVLYGFERMLKEMRVDLVEAEVGMNPENRRHVPFEAVKRYLEHRGYRLFLIYKQRRETPFGRGAMLRRCNVVFASAKLLDAARG